MIRKRILLLSAYDAESHRYWHQQLVSGMPEHEWNVVALPDRYFAWRASGNALSFNAWHHEQLSRDYDVVIATSMVDLATLRGMYSNLTGCANLLYFHENQMAYPPNQRQRGQAERELRQIQASVCADQLVFNSEFNRSSFLDGITAFAQRMPDGFPEGLVSQLRHKSKLLAVPVKMDCEPKNEPKPGGLQVVWNHRWEHDKGPETLLAVMQLTSKENIGYHIMGRSFRNQPKAMQQIQAEHSDQCLTFGYVDSRSEYIATLQQSDVALSTAWHDFQGISVLEAAACGCAPLVPDRLVYPELYATANRYQSSPEDIPAEAEAIVARLLNPTPPPQAEVTHRWSDLKQAYIDWVSAW